jgi:hypothetical protein
VFGSSFSSLTLAQAPHHNLSKDHGAFLWGHLFGRLVFGAGPLRSGYARLHPRQPYVPAPLNLIFKKYLVIYFPVIMVCYYLLHYYFGLVVVERTG